MKITLSSAKLLKAITPLMKIVPDKPVVPILENLCFTASNDLIAVSSSDMEVIMETTLDAQTSESGAFVVPAKLLFSALKSLPEQPLVMTVTDKGVSVKTTNGKFNLPVEDHKDWPGEPNQPNMQLVDVDPAELSGAFRSNMFALGTDHVVRPVVTGMLMESKVDILNVTALNGFIIAQKTFQVAMPEFRIVVPAKAARVIADNKGDLFHNGKHLRYECANFTMISRLIEEEYPNYDRIIENEGWIVRVNRESFVGLIHRARPFASGAGNIVQLDISEDSIKAMTSAIDQSSSFEEEIPCVSSIIINIAFDASYLEEVLTHAPGDTVYMKIEDPTKSAIITTDTAGALSTVAPFKIFKEAAHA